MPTRPVDGFASAQSPFWRRPTARSRSVAENMAHPNGLAITSAHELLVAETLGNRLLAFKIEADGTLLHRRVFANFERMSPLGICSDSEGAVWTAAARQPLFVRVMQGGRVTHRVHVPGRHAVACQLGGRDGRTLFCLTVAANLGEYSDRQQTARVETTPVDVPGAAGIPRFAEIARSLAFRTDVGICRRRSGALKANMMVSEKQLPAIGPSPYLTGLIVPLSALRQGKAVRRILDAEIQLRCVRPRFHLCRRRRWACHIRHHDRRRHRRRSRSGDGGQISTAVLGPRGAVDPVDPDSHAMALARPEKSFDRVAVSSQGIAGEAHPARRRIAPGPLSECLSSCRGRWPRRAKRAPPHRVRRHKISDRPGRPATSSRTPIK